MQHSSPTRTGTVRMQHHGGGQVGLGDGLHSFEQLERVQARGGLDAHLRRAQRLHPGTVNIQDDLQVQVGAPLHQAPVRLAIDVGFECRQGTEATHGGDRPLQQVLKFRLVKLHSQRRIRGLQGLPQKNEPAFHPFEERIQQIAARAGIAHRAFAAGQVYLRGKGQRAGELNLIDGTGGSLSPGLFKGTAARSPRTHPVSQQVNGGKKPVLCQGRLTCPAAGTVHHTPAEGRAVKGDSLTDCQGARGRGALPAGGR